VEELAAQDQVKALPFDRSALLQSDIRVESARAAQQVTRSSSVGTGARSHGSCIAGEAGTAESAGVKPGRVGIRLRVQDIDGSNQVRANQVAVAGARGAGARPGAAQLRCYIERESGPVGEDGIQAPAPGQEFRSRLPEIGKRK